MSENFNLLTAAQSESLALLAEECAEVVQIIGKILRHGANSCHPDSPRGPDNADQLAMELGDVFAAYAIVRKYLPDVRHWYVMECRASKLARVGDYLHHATVGGLLR